MCGLSSRELYENEDHFGNPHNSIGVLVQNRFSRFANYNAFSCKYRANDMNLPTYI